MITFAHGLYIDDILWFAIPVGISILVLRWAERKARARAEQSGPDSAEPASD